MKAKQLIPTCYFPTTNIIVDDNRAYLESLSLTLDEDLNNIVFDSPLDTLDFLQEKYEVGDSLTAKCIEQSDCVVEESTNGQVVHIKLDAIFQTVYNPERFKEISTIVVDYSMPGMNGIELLNNIKHLPCKKIMLTGQADQVLAVSAFNAGIIDKFILKSEVEAMEKTGEAIAELQHAYFLEASKSLYETLATSADCALNDKKFFEFFQATCAEYNVVEYYLVQTPGSFLLLTMDGKALWLLVKSSADMRMYLEVARDGGAPEQVITGLANGTRIPHFWNDRHFYSVSGRAWETFMYDAEKLIGENDEYHYAVVEKQIGSSGLDIKQVLSYDDFLSSL